MANDINRRSQQSFIVAYPQKSSTFDIAIGYFERIRSLEVYQKPKVCPHKSIEWLHTNKYVCIQLKWFYMNSKFSTANISKEHIPYQNPCILVDDYTVYIIGGRNKNGAYLTTTLRAKFAISDDQVSRVLE